MSKCNRVSPCYDCPFARHTQPGTLGGASVWRYVGQVNGNFWLPCHQTPNYQGQGSRYSEDAHECAGVAIFRANIESKGQSPAILRLPKNTRTVFASFAEFVAHHKGVTEQQAQRMLEQSTPDHWTEVEMQGQVWTERIAR